MVWVGVGLSGNGVPEDWGKNILIRRQNCQGKVLAAAWRGMALFFTGLDIHGWNWQG